MSGRFFFVVLAFSLLASCTLGTTPPSATSPTETFIPIFPPPSMFTPAPPKMVEFYRLRIQYETTSDWSTLDLLTSENVLAIRAMNVIGKPENYQVGVEQLTLNQSIAEAEAGNKVGVIVDYAIAPEALDQPLQFRVKKGDLNGSKVEVINLTGGTPESIQSFNHTGTVTNSGGLNPKDFNADLSTLKASQPLSATSGHANLPKMLLAFYYPWYSLKDWSNNTLKDHPTPPYSSGNTGAITHQIELAQSAGIDGFISSWWGPDSNTDQNLKILLPIAEQKNFKVAIYFETLSGPDGGPLDAASIQTWLAYAIENYGDNPAFIKVNGKPLIVIWASGTVPLETWKSIFASLRDQGLDAVYLGLGHDLNILNVFDGLHEYGVFTYPDLTQMYLSTSSAVRNYSLLADQPVQKIWVATVQPGYDDRSIPGRTGLLQDRQNGDFYRSTWESAIQSDPDWIFITTWNEWWENTAIEPGELYGDQYLQITKEFAEQWK